MNDPSRRILCLSADNERALMLIRRIKALSRSPSSFDASSDLGQRPESGSRFPWTIVNKYYSADVHFEVRRLSDWCASDDVKAAVPAVIFVWASGEPWKEHAQLVAAHLKRGGCEPEVALAVRLRTAIPPAVDSEEDNMDLVLSELGFEFVDALEGGSLKGRACQYDESNDIPDLPRVVDALSSIMWPSMKTTMSMFGLRSGSEWANQSGDKALSDFEPVTRHSQTFGELDTWLEPGDSTFEKDGTWAPPQSTLYNEGDSVTFMASPTTLNDITPFFDDDFTVFVSAPSDDPTDGFSTPNDLAPMRTGGSYVSLGSVSNLGESERTAVDGEYCVEEDEGIPSQDEIRATSDRIFGEHPTSALDADEMSPADEDLTAFDLTRILSVLDGMKEEINGIENDTERREAAARVALGLVHGLEIG